MPFNYLSTVIKIEPGYTARGERDRDGRGKGEKTETTDKNVHLQNLQKSNNQELSPDKMS